MDSIKRLLERNKSLIKDNFILFVSFFILNLLGYLFHFYAGRNLGPSDYGIFGSLLSLIYIIAMPLTAIQTTITKFVADFKAKGEYEKISYLLKGSLRKLFLIGILITIFYLILSPVIASFLKIETLMPVMLLGAFLFFALLIPITRGFLQGMQRFKQLGLSFILEGIAKFGFGLLLIPTFLRVNGAIISFILAYTFPFILTLYFLRRTYWNTKEKFNTKEIYKYSFPVILMLISLTGFYTIDIILVKHFLSSIEAGYYAALTLIGKIIFFGSMSISMVMVPKIADLYAKKKNTIRLMLKSLGIVGLFGFIITLIYFLFPELIIGMLFGSEYLEITKYIGFFAIFISVFSLVYVLGFYNISLNRSKFIYILLLFNLIEGGLIYFMHKSIMQIIFILIALISLLFLIMSIYTFIGKNERLDTSNTGI